MTAKDRNDYNHFMKGKPEKKPMQSAVQPNLAPFVPPSAGNMNNMYMPNMAGMGAMGGMGGIPNMGAMGNMGGMPNMGNMGNMPNMPNMGNLNRPPPANYMQQPPPYYQKN